MYLWLHVLTVINLNFVSFRLCTGLAWDKEGDTLGIIHDNKSGINHMLLLFITLYV